MMSSVFLSVFLIQNNQRTVSVHPCCANLTLDWWVPKVVHKRKEAFNFAYNFTAVCTEKISKDISLYQTKELSDELSMYMYKVSAIFSDSLLWR